MYKKKEVRKSEEENKKYERKKVAPKQSRNMERCNSGALSIRCGLYTKPKTASYKKGEGQNTTRHRRTFG